MGRLLTCEYHLHGLRLANGAGEPLSAPSTWDGTQVDLWLTKGGLLPGVYDVAHHGHFTPSSQGKAIHGRNDGLTSFDVAFPAT